MMNWLAFALSMLVLAAVHEGAHALVAAGYGELAGARFLPPGIEIIYMTPLEDRAGLMWAFISGGANAATLGLGYLLLSIRHRLACVHNPLARGTLYYTTLLALVVDPLNLSIGPLLYGGDLGGIAVGLDVPPPLLQIVFGILLLVNRELVAQVLLPAYGIVTNHPLVRPWFTTTFFRGTLCFIAGYFFLMGAFLILFPNMLLARLGEPGSSNMLGILRGAGAATVPYTMLYILLVVKNVRLSEFNWPHKKIQPTVPGKTFLRQSHDL